MTKNSRQEIKELKQEILELQCITSHLSKIVFRLEEELDKEERVAEVVSIPEAVPVCPNKIPRIVNPYRVNQDRRNERSPQQSSSNIICTNQFKLKDVVVVTNDRIDSKGVQKRAKGTVVDFCQNFVIF